MPATLTASQRDWLRVRSYLSEHRHGLALDAAGDYPADLRIAGTPLLAAPRWRPAEPVPLPEVWLELTPAEAQPPITGPSAALHRAAAPLLPERPDGTRYLRYSDALRDLAAPAVFENRVTYRLTEAQLTTGLTPRERPGSHSPAAAISTASTPARRPRTNTRPRGSAAARPACAP